MNFQELQQAEKKYDELMVVGKTIEIQERIYHIVGMIREKMQAVLYILELDDFEEKKENIKNRMSMKGAKNSYFFDIGEFKIENAAYSVQQASSGCLGVNNCEMQLLFFDMMRAGWKPQDNPFWTVDWDKILLTSVVLELKQEKLPVWQGEIFVKLHKRPKVHLIEQPVCLTIGEKKKLEFTLKNGEKGICYINKVYPIDVWKEQEKQFENPKYLERMTKEELEDMKQKFYCSLEQNCPKGMCFLAIEYECTLEGSLVFHDSAFLDAKPTEIKITGTGGTSILFMRLKPDNPIGEHGFQNLGCIIQTVVSSDIQSLSAELFQFVEILPEKEELLIRK